MSEEVDTAKGAARQQPDLDAIANRILFNLKLGSQEPRYKVARKVLREFIKHLTQ